MTVNILLADDHPLVRRGLRNLLEAEPDLCVVGEAEDGLQVVQMAEKLRPTIMVVDLMMPHLNGLEVIREVRRRNPQTLAVVLSMQRADPYIVEAFRAGASGYVLKDGAPGEVIHAIRQALLGVKYLSPKLPVGLLDQRSGSAADPEQSRYETLTDREREVFQMAAEGRTAAEIGRLLSISTRTAELHRSRMMDKLGLRNQTELVRYAVSRGVLPTDV
ncbi:MAG TPA: response regulator transcription factor [Anaerolineales bacterium]|nr:response regulator transcription factor [Anaerolineales bacterium]